MTVVDDHPGTILDTTIDEPGEKPVNIPASLGAVGYAAFALVQPIPLDEIVPFQTLMTAFEAEAAALTAPPAEVTTIDAPPEPAPVPEPAYIQGGYRPAPVSESWSRDLQDRVAGYAGPAPRMEVPELEPSAPANETVLEEMAALGIGNEPSNQPVQPGEEVPVDESFPAVGYAANRASVDSRARQVLDELSFLFDGK